jgi:hypothetical protein
MHLRNDKMTDLTDATIQLVYDIGAGMTMELDVTELFDISANAFADAALTPIYTLLANSMYKIGRGLTPSRTADFLKVVKRCEIDISIVNHNGVEHWAGAELPPCSCQDLLTADCQEQQGYHDDCACPWFWQR